METLGNAILPNSAPKFYCQKCDYGTCKKSSYDDHLLSTKHHKETNGNKWKQKFCDSFYCENCNKKFSSRSGLWKHKKKCNTDTDTIDEEPKKEKISDEKISDKELIVMLLKQNSQLIEHNCQITKNGINHTNNSHNINNTNNSHNKSFNLQFFLNETCKDAMNIMDFVDSIKLQLSDLENVGKIGYVEGISNIIVKNLNSLDETKRPFHCTDKKREVMYVKDEDKCEKENENKPKIRRVIKKIAHKNSMLLNEFKNKHPDCLKSVSKFSDHYNNLTINKILLINNKNFYI